MWPFGRMIMCHMFATTDEELREMADKIGVARRWEQKPRESIGPHYDISKSKRALAIQHGAIACDDIYDEVEAFGIVERERHPRGRPSLR
jgi:hypothetical protein